jgi:hypothetical protein
MSAPVSNRNELIRTTFRLFIILMCEGLGQLPSNLQRSQEGKCAHKALLAANDFFFDTYEPEQLDGALDRLCAGIAPLANLEFDPIRLYVFTRFSRPVVRKITRHILARNGWRARAGRKTFRVRPKILIADNVGRPPTAEVFLFPGSRRQEHDPE